MAAPIRIGIVGLGKITRDQHIPAIRANPSYELVAGADPQATLDGLPSYKDLPAMIAGTPMDAVALNTPPSVRHDLASQAMAAGLSVFLEKPPAATLSEAADLQAMAAARDVTLFASWHSREATAVRPAKEWLAGKTVKAVRITWKEDIRRWHPGQEWILGPGGFGVFDPGINALSVTTGILPQPVFVEKATLTVPRGRQQPLEAVLEMRSGAAPVHAELSSLQTGPQTWEVVVETDAGVLTLEDGGETMLIDGAKQQLTGPGEYPGLYKRFAELVAAGQSDVDVAPLRLVADAFLLADRQEGQPFTF